MTELKATSHSKVRRVAKRASYESSKVYQLVDDLKLGHVGFIVNNRPVVIPMTVWRVEQHLYLHVANKSRLQRHFENGGECSISFAQYNEWVMSKSAYHHSANYRSAVLYCTGSRVTDDETFDQAFKVIINQIEEGRWGEVRTPNALERKATALMQLTINEGSFKAREGGPVEEQGDLSLPVWNGTKPVCPFHS